MRRERLRFNNQNQLGALLFEFFSRSMIERHLFQKAGISSESMVYLANDLISLVSKAKKPPFNFSTELGIFYKQLIGKKLTKEEQEYDEEGIHDLDVVGEIFNGFRYAVGYIAATNLWASVSSLFSGNLAGHLLPFVSSAAMFYAGPFVLKRCVDAALDRSHLSDQQRTLLRPWLYSMGRLVVALMPRVSANKEGVSYYSPFAVEHIKGCQKIKINTSRVPDKNEATFFPEGVCQESFFLDSMQSLNESSMAFTLRSTPESSLPVKVTVTHSDRETIINLNCNDSFVEAKCAQFFSKITGSQEEVTVASGIGSQVQYGVRDALQYLMGDVASFALSSLASLAIQRGGLKFGSLIGVALSGLIELPNALCQNAVVNLQGVRVATRREEEGVSVLTLSGTHEAMGQQYGLLMQYELRKALDILKNYFIFQHGISYEKLVERADLFYNRYGYSYQQFLKGMATGAGLTLDECKILNGMETLNSLVEESSLLSWCAFLSIPPSKTASNKTLIGRNYDFPPPYNLIADYLVVTVLNEPNSVPTAIIAMVGQIYCPSCVNANGVFAEFNNGMPSGGYAHRFDRQSLLVNLMQGTQNAPTLEQLRSELMAMQSDYSLIVNTADSRETYSYEFSATLGMRPYTPDPRKPFASTNFYLNQTWEGIPEPSDNTTWFGVTRRENLLSLAGKLKKADVPEMQQLMDVKIEDGGAVWNFTIYQIIFDPSSLKLYVRTAQSSEKKWSEVQLKQAFNFPGSLFYYSPESNGSVDELAPVVLSMG